MSNARNLANLLGTNTTIQTAKLADSAITAAKLADAAVTATKLPSGSVLQVVRYSETNTAGIGANTTYDWRNVFAPATGVTAKKANSIWVVTTQFWIASRGSATSTDIWWKVGSSGTWDSLGGHGTGGGNETGSYGMGTIWDTGSSDIWMGAAHHGSKAITHSAGDVLYFKAMMRRGGPGADSEAGGNNDAKHDDVDTYLTVMEVSS